MTIREEAGFHNTLCIYPKRRHLCFSLNLELPLLRLQLLDHFIFSLQLLLHKCHSRSLRLRLNFFSFLSFSLLSAELALHIAFFSQTAGVSLEPPYFFCELLFLLALCGDGRLEVFD
jgi:hypothetical protein